MYFYIIQPEVGKLNLDVVIGSIESKVDGAIKESCPVQSLLCFVAGVTVCSHFYLCGFDFSISDPTKGFVQKNQAISNCSMLVYL